MSRPFICFLWLGSLSAAVSVAQTTTGVSPQTTAVPEKSTLSAAELSDDELAAAVANSVGPVGIVPTYRGLNASLISSSQHDSISGWSNLMTPSVAYRFNRVFSADISTPIFLYIHTESTVATTFAQDGAPTGFSTASRSQHGIVGDTVMAAHAHLPAVSLARHGLYNTLSGLLIAPTGSVSDGVGAGKTAWNLTNHVEAAGRWSPYVDVGLGTSSRVQNRRLQRDQTSRGLLANFAAGGRILLPRQMVFGLEAYEQLPLGTQHVSSTEVRQGGPPETSQVTTTSGVAEDNGFNTALDIPLTPHLTLSGYYSRSLRQHEDIAGFSFTFLLKAAGSRRY